jgi:hypothetical protein
MMICDADFEDLFPDLFPTRARRAAARGRTALSETCLARQKVDDGDRVRHTLARNDAFLRARLKPETMTAPAGQKGRSLPLSV